MRRALAAGAELCELLLGFFSLLVVVLLPVVVRRVVEPFFTVDSLFVVVEVRLVPVVRRALFFFAGIACVVSA